MVTAYDKLLAEGATLRSILKARRKTPAGAPEESWATPVHHGGVTLHIGTASGFGGGLVLTMTPSGVKRWMRPNKKQLGHLAKFHRGEAAAARSRGARLHPMQASMRADHEEHARLHEDAADAYEKAHKATGALTASTKDALGLKSTTALDGVRGSNPHRKDHEAAASHHEAEAKRATSAVQRTGHERAAKAHRHAAWSGPSDVAWDLSTDANQTPADGGGDVVGEAKKRASPVPAATGRPTVAGHAQDEPPSAHDVAKMVQHFQLPGHEYGDVTPQVYPLMGGQGALIGVGGTHWMLTNNGSGELMLGRLNIDQLHHKIPTTFPGFVDRHHNAGTLAARVAAVIREPDAQHDYRNDEGHWLSHDDVHTIRGGAPKATAAAPTAAPEPAPARAAPSEAKSKSKHGVFEVRPSASGANWGWDVVHGPSGHVVRRRMRKLKHAKALAQHVHEQVGHVGPDGALSHYDEHHISMVERSWNPPGTPVDFDYR